VTPVARSRPARAQPAAPGQSAARVQPDGRAGVVSPARVCAFAVVRRVFEQAAYADRAFTAEAVDLAPRDRALAMALAYGTVQRRATLDHVVGRLSSRPADELDPPVLAALRLGLFQLLLLDGVADHAAVNDSVELAKRAQRGGAGLVNAVLRRAVREGPAIIDELDDDTADAAAILHSVPPWLAELWWNELGADQARALLRRINRPAESALRVNTLLARRDDVLTELLVAARPATEATTRPAIEVTTAARPATGESAAARPATGELAAARPAAELPEGIVLDQPFDAHASELWARGEIMPQSRGSMLVSRVLEPRPGERVLDLCAAPGAKTTHLGALMSGEGRLIAVERHPGRADALARTIARMHVDCARVRLGDARTIDVTTELSGDRGSPAGYQRVLVDPPCSGLGTLQSRPDLRWRTDPARIADLVPLQSRILRAGAAALAPGGVLVYSVCTISRAESEAVIEDFLREHREFRADDLGNARADDRPGPYLQLLPHVDDTDGFFIAALRRA
jgi:16S rRNA (cytosine967-C5)-methyltransferase